MVQCLYKEVSGRERVGELGTSTPAIGERITGPFEDDKEVAEVVEYDPKPVTLVDGTMVVGGTVDLRIIVRPQASEAWPAPFRKAIKRMPVYTATLEDCEPIRMETRGERNALRRIVETRVPTGKGIYCLYERKPGQVAAMYVGRSNSLTDRLLSHGQPKNDNYSATFAFLLAKSKFPRSADMSAKELQADLEFQKGVISQFPPPT